MSGKGKVIHLESKSSQKGFSKYEEALLTIVMHDLAEEEGRTLLLQEEGREKRQIDEDDLAIFQKKLHAAFEKDERVRKKKQMLQRAGKIAVLFIALFTISTVSVLSVDALRVKVLNFMMDVQESFTEVGIKDEQKNEIDLVRTQVYTPDYLPKEFHQTEQTKDSLFVSTTWENQEGEIISLTEFDEASNTQIDTENAETKEVKIKGQEGLAVKKKGTYNIVWSVDDKYFVLTTTLNESESIKIANSVNKSL